MTVRKQGVICDSRLGHGVLLTGLLLCRLGSGRRVTSREAPQPPRDLDLQPDQLREIPMDEVDVIIVEAGPKGYVHARGCVDGGLPVGP